MPLEIRVPAMGESVVEATIAGWLKQEGEPVTVGEPLVELETDKANTELPADDTGVLEKILVREGETVRPGDVLGVIAPGAPAADGAAAGDGVSPPSSPPPPAESVPAPPDQEEGETDERVRASPLAERVAGELGVDLAEVSPSGPGGRVTREDVEAHARAAKIPVPQGHHPAPAAEVPPPLSAPLPPSTPPVPAAPPAPAVEARPAPPPPRPAPAAPTPEPGEDRAETRQRLSRRRLTIARRLVEAQRTAAMLTTFNEADMSAVIALRQRRREKFKEQHGVSLGYMSFFTRAVVGALKAFPILNSELQEDELVLKRYYDIGIAIGDEEGLVVPVLRDADRLTFAEIERAIAGFVEKARNHALTLEELRGGTFTITNGGVFGSLLSTPILNPPQVGILGMHKIEERPVAVNGEVVIRPMMYLALSYDHRVADGREAVQFLVRVKELIEDPERLLLEG